MTVTSSGSPAVCNQTRGFASPPREGFAFVVDRQTASGDTKPLALSFRTKLACGPFGDPPSAATEFAPKVDENGLVETSVIAFNDEPKKRV